MVEKAKLMVDGKTLELPIVRGSEGETAIDISNLRAKTGLITYDPGFANTGSCLSSITFLDGEKGILRYRGIPVEQLAEHSICGDRLLANQWGVAYQGGAGSLLCLLK
jgi:citrate synthase